MPGVWERACPRWQRCAVPARPRRPHRRQASSHRLFIANRICALPGAFVGAGLPAMASLRCISHTASPGSQASQLPQVMHCQRNLRLARSLCGSGLARDGSTAVCLPDRAVCIAGKPAPTGYSSPTESVPCQEPLWERACPRWQRCGVPGTPQGCHREQARSHRGVRLQLCCLINASNVHPLPGFKSLCWR